MDSRKTKIEVRSVPEPVNWILKNSTGEQLDYLDALAKSTNFKLLVKIVTDFKHYNVYEVFRAVVDDARQLEVLRAAKRGEVAGLDALLMACQAASAEIERRRSIKEHGSA